MEVKELASLIKTRVEIIGTDIKHLESITKYATQNQQFADAFAALYLSLQNTVYIELFKFFDDSGKNAKQHNVYALINLIEDDKSTYHKMLSSYSKDIESIKYRRNHLHGHEFGENGTDVYKKYPISCRLDDLLKCIADICCVADDNLYPNTYCRNVREFDDWCYMSLDAIKETCTLHGKVFTIADVSMDVFYENLDDYLLVLKQKHISGCSDV